MDMSIQMVCEKHKMPVVFASKEQNKYFCFKCLIANDNLLYIDKTYKSEMDDFIDIKKKTHDVIVRNLDKTDIVDKWKSNIRDKLVQTKLTFNRRIDRYIEMFSERFRHIEEAQIMVNEKGEPSRLNDESKSIKDTLDELKTFHNEILRIFEKISNSPAE